MLKPGRFSCSQKIRLKWDPPVLMLQLSRLVNAMVLTAVAPNMMPTNFSPHTPISLYTKTSPWQNT